MKETILDTAATQNYRNKNSSAFFTISTRISTTI